MHTLVSVVYPYERAKQGKIDAELVFDAIERYEETNRVDLSKVNGVTIQVHPSFAAPDLQESYNGIPVDQSCTMCDRFPSVGIRLPRNTLEIS